MLAANNVMAKNAGPGAWNDLDPVMIGAGIEGQLSVPEARSLFTLFAAVKAPLLLGSDPSRMGAEYLDIAKNAEVIAINQDPLGVAAVAVAASEVRPSFAYSRFVHSFHARRDRVVLLPPCSLYGVATLRPPPLGPGRGLTLPCGWNNAGTTATTRSRQSVATRVLRGEAAGPPRASFT